MRVFCHEHKRGFFAPRQSPIKCENRGHLIGELDFSGEHSAGHSPFPLQWQYCCNCEHFCIIDFDNDGLERCPVCTRRSSTLYLCDRCYTISFESNTPLDTKNFTISSDGVPSPCCPGCLHPAAADLREHACDDVHLSIITALNTCPICNERLDIGPSFPASVAQYLKRTKSANKTFVTFDYESGLFVPVEDGEFVLIKNNDETNKTFVLPRSPRLATLRDFYELYQDYYHCAAPEAGEINVSEPAVVVPMGDGWKLLAPGVFHVVPDNSKNKVTPPVVAPRPEPSIRPAPLPTAETQSRNEIVEARGPSFAKKPAALAAATRCTYCDTLIEAKYAFCWKCGSARSDNVKSSATHDEQESEDVAGLRPPRSRLIVQAMEEDEAESPTVQHPPRVSLLQRRGRQKDDEWLTDTAREPSLSQSRSVLKLFVIGFVGLLLISLAVLAVWETKSSVSAQVAETLTNQPTVPANSQPQTAEKPAASAEMRPVALKTSSPEVPEVALEQLRQMRTSSDHSKILKSLSDTEMKYADDYRFPYERARVVVIDHKKNFHEEAFAALARAAQKAINKGKSNEMLQSLDKDSSGDFQKLAHGHREWTQLQKALKSRNAAVLSVNEGL
jgi:hypothetical protein